MAKFNHKNHARNHPQEVPAGPLEKLQFSARNISRQEIAREFFNSILRKGPHDIVVSGITRLRQERIQREIFGLPGAVFVNANLLPSFESIVHFMSLERGLAPVSSSEQGGRNAWGSILQRRAYLFSDESNVTIGFRVPVSGPRSLSFSSTTGKVIECGAMVHPADPILLGLGVLTTSLSEQQTIWFVNPHNRDERYRIDSNELKQAAWFATKIPTKKNNHPLGSESTLAMALKVIAKVICTDPGMPNAAIFKRLSSHLWKSGHSKVADNSRDALMSALRDGRRIARIHKQLVVILDPTSKKILKTFELEPPPKATLAEPPTTKDSTSTSVQPRILFTPIHKPETPLTEFIKSALQNDELKLLFGLSAPFLMLPLDKADPFLERFRCQAHIAMDQARLMLDELTEEREFTVRRKKKEHGLPLLGYKLGYANKQPGVHQYGHSAAMHSGEDFPLLLDQRFRTHPTISVFDPSYGDMRAVARILTGGQKYLLTEHAFFRFLERSDEFEYERKGKSFGTALLTLHDRLFHSEVVLPRNREPDEISSQGFPIEYRRDRTCLFVIEILPGSKRIKTCKPFNG